MTRRSNVVLGATSCQVRAAATFLLFIASTASAETVEVVASQDAWVYGAVPGSNYGSADTLEVAGTPTNYKRHALFKWDLANLPIFDDPDVQILSAQVVLRMRAATDWGGDLHAYLAANDAEWSETTVTFNNAPTATTVVSDTLDFMDVYADPWHQRTFTLNAAGIELVNAWAQGQPNFGLKLRPVDLTAESHTQQVRSREAADSLDHPKLILGYAVLSVPEAVTDLTATDVDTTQTELQWTAPAGLVYAEATGSYDLRFATWPIDEANFDLATSVAGLPTPAVAGTVQSHVLTDLTPDTTYYLALRSVGPYGDLLSPLSNVLVITTDPPDTTPPAAVNSLEAVTLDDTWVSLLWAASGDDGWVGRADHYVIRYATWAITEANFASATLVDQDITPAQPLTVETLTISALTPDTTYYVALKVVDEADNVSPLSNVLTVTTRPPDQTPPAPITNLTVTGVDDRSISLRWTAPGDDGHVGEAARYDIRWSTAPIDLANWDQATPLSAPPVPQPAGTTESALVTGLLPATTYYIAVRTADEADNLSGLSNGVAATTAEPPLVTTVTLVDKSNTTTTGYPITLSLVFREGQVTSAVTARVDGDMLPTQTDVKVRYSDGSVRHAVVSFILPVMPAGGQVAVEVLSGGSNADSDYVDVGELLATDFEAVMDLIVDGNAHSVSARQVLAGLPEVRYWLKGDVCCELLIRDLNVNVENQLNVQYYARLYPGWEGIRIDTVVENCWSDFRGNITYDFDLHLGLADPIMVLSRTDFTHNFNARWRKTFWLGDEPPEIEIHYDLDDAIGTGTLPPYDTSLSVPESTLASAYSWWLSSDHDIMQGGRIMRYFPSSGGREDIGVYPAWAARYLLSMDNRLREVTLNYGDLSGSIPIHIRESDPTRTFYQHVLSIDDRPTVWTGWWDFGPTAAVDRLPAPIGSTSTEWTVDGAHQPSLACIPYLVTGDYYYLEEMYFWAGWDLSDMNFSVRGYDAGWIHDQARGIAWRTRNLADAANLAPDDDVLEKSYFTQKVINNIAHWDDIYISEYFPTVRYLQIISPAERPAPELDANVAYYSLPWQDDFVLMVAAHMRDMGFDTTAMIQWLGESLINRYRHPDMNWYRGTPYKLPTHLYDGAGQPAIIETWAEVNDGFVDDVGPSTFEGYYHGQARAALALVTDMPQGLPAYKWLHESVYNPASSAADPTWALVAHIAGDTDGDLDVDLDDMATFVGAMAGPGVPTATPEADLDGDGDCDLADAALFVAGFSGAL